MHQSRRPFIAELDLMRWGLAMARKGGVSAQHTFLEIFYFSFKNRKRVLTAAAIFA